MSALLVVAGAVIGFVAAWLLMRSRPPDGVPATPRVEPVEPVGVRDVLQGHPTGVVLSDAGAVWFRNAAATRLSGTHAGVLLDAAVERHLRAARNGAVGDEVVQLYGPPKSVFEVRSMPLPGGGAAAFVDDISERRRLDQVRTDFVANVSHELKTPIGALAVLAETLTDDTDQETTARVVARMLAEADRAAHMIDDLMELSRIESETERTTEPVRVRDVVRGAADRVTELAARRTITVSMLDRSESGADDRSTNSIVVDGDRRQLISAVGNLVENAVKYSEAGSSVTVGIRRDGNDVEISVSDEGAGIPQRDLDRIFERFYRVDRARSRTTGGTGLGLAIVRHVASNHGGEVLVSSVEGEGSTFTLRLPISGHTGAGAGSGDDTTHETAVDVRGRTEQGVA
jgi:two-component system, OmpR family, sensor histidine kinase SenX3